MNEMAIPRRWLRRVLFRGERRITGHCDHCLAGVEAARSASIDRQAQRAADGLLPSLLMAARRARKNGSSSHEKKQS